MADSSSNDESFKSCNECFSDHIANDFEMDIFYWETYKDYKFLNECDFETLLTIFLLQKRVHNKFLNECDFDTVFFL